MSISVNITNAEGPFSDEDKAVIAALNTALNGGTTQAISTSTPSSPAKAPVKKAAAPAPAKEAAEVAPDPEPETPANAPDEASTEELMAQAVAVATGLVATNAGKVREALGKFNAKRVSEVAPGDLAAFIAALS